VARLREEKPPTVTAFNLVHGPPVVGSVEHGVAALDGTVFRPPTAGLFLLSALPGALVRRRLR